MLQPGSRCGEEQGRGCQRATIRADPLVDRSVLVTPSSLFVSSKTKQTPPRHRALCEKRFTQTWKLHCIAGGETRRSQATHAGHVRLGSYLTVLGARTRVIKVQSGEKHSSWPSLRASSASPPSPSFLSHSQGQGDHQPLPRAGPTAAKLSAKIRHARQDKTRVEKCMQENPKFIPVDPPAGLLAKPKIKRRTSRILPGLEHEGIPPVTPEGAPGALVLFRPKVVHSVALPVVSPCVQVCLSVILLAPRVCRLCYLLAWSRRIQSVPI